MSADSIIQLLHLLAPLLSLGGMVVSHTLLCRLRSQAEILNMLALAGFAGSGVLLAVELVTIFVGQSWPEALLTMLLVDGPIYGCLAYGYANFVNLGHASVRIRIYRELLGSPSGVEVSALRAKYDEAGMLSTRLQRMLEAKDLAFDGASYRLRKMRLLVISNVIFGLKKAVLGRTSEFAP